MNSIHNEYAVKVIIQNLINKFWFRTDDADTIDNIQKQIGKEDKIKYSKTISENAKETHYSYFTNSLNSEASNLSESINKYIPLIINANDKLNKVPTRYLLPNKGSALIAYERAHVFT